MKYMTELMIDGPPLPWKAPYVGTRGAFSCRTSVMADFREVIKLQYKHPLIECAVRCDIICYMPIPKSTSKKKRILMIQGDIRPTGTPDRINLAKLAEDVLQGVVLKNDSQIVEGEVSKWYDERPRVYMRITEL